MQICSYILIFSHDHHLKILDLYHYFLTSKVMYVLILTSVCFIFIFYGMCYCIYEQLSSNLLIYTIFYIAVTYLQILFSELLTNLLATTDFPSLCVITIISLIYCAIHYFYLPIFHLFYVFQI